jgi:hypothetical protein
MRCCAILAIALAGADAFALRSAPHTLVTSRSGVVLGAKRGGANKGASKARTAAPPLAAATLEAEPAVMEAEPAVVFGDTGGAALLVENMGLDRGAAELLRGVNWRVMPGERWGIVGPNGAGKRYEPSPPPSTPRRCTRMNTNSLGAYLLTAAVSPRLCRVGSRARCSAR